MHILTERYNNDKDLLLNSLKTYFCITTESQFDRCLDQLFGIVLSPEDDAKLMEKYCQPYNSYNVSSENVVLDQLIIPKLISKNKKKYSQQN